MEDNKEIIVQDEEIESSESDNKKKTCLCCGKTMRKNNFFSTKSKYYKDGYTAFCKDCCNNIFYDHYNVTGNIKEALIVTCCKLDLLVFPSLIEWAEKSKNSEDVSAMLKNKTFLGLFIKKTNLKSIMIQSIKTDLCFENSNFCGIPFKEVPKMEEDGRVYSEDEEIAYATEPEDETTIITRKQLKEFRDKFGNYNDDDLRWLGKKYLEWDEHYDISELNKQKLIIQLVCDEFSIVKKREQGEDVSKQWKTFMDTMKQLELTPKQQAKNSTGTGFASLGDFIKEVERTKPIINRDPRFEDVDGINKIKVAMAGALARTLGKENQYSRAFEKIYKQYSSDILSTSSYDEDDG